MKKQMLHSLLLVFASTMPLMAQDTQQASTESSQPPVAADDWKPSSINQKGKEYPQTNSERRARFRVIAPEAQSVSVSLGKLALAKGPDGAWIHFHRSVGDFGSADAVAKREALPIQVPANTNSSISNPVNSEPIISQSEPVSQAEPVFDPKFLIFLCFGQSNMEGGARMEEFDRIGNKRFQVMADFDNPERQWKKGNWYEAVPPLTKRIRGLTLVDYFGKTMVANMPEEYRIGVIKVAVSSYLQLPIASSAAVSTTSVSPSQPSQSVVLKDVFKNDFLVGVAVNRSVTMGQAFRRSQEDVASDVALVKKHFNQVVAENEMKWQVIHPRTGEEGYDFAAADALAKFAEENQMQLAGHTLVWHSQTPNWVFEGTQQPSDQVSVFPGYESLTIGQPRLPPGRPLAKPANPQPQAGSASDGPQNPPTNRSDEPAGRPRGPGRLGTGGFGGFQPFNLAGPRASRDELLQRMREHIHAVVGRYKGKVKVWDVVNEALSDSGPEVLRYSPWSAIIGPDFIAKAFEYAHEADPDAILRYNDYGLENPAKLQKLLVLIKALQANEIPVMAIGTQAHCNVGTSFQVMDESLTEMESLGLPIHVTELDVNTSVRGQQGTEADIAANAAATQGGQVADPEKKLADAYAGLFKAFVKHKKAVDIVTFWGVNDAVSWRSQGKPLLFDGSNAPKPAFDAVITIGHGDGR